MTSSLLFAARHPHTGMHINSMIARDHLGAGSDLVGIGSARSKMTAGSARVVIVGAGFGGLQAASTLARSSVELLLIDRENARGKRATGAADARELSPKRTNSP